MTVVVSHRFSTVLMADRIAVLAAGRLAEFGPHRDLMAAGGLYAELFALQARAYGRMAAGLIHFFQTKADYSFWTACSSIFPRQGHLL